MLQPKFQLEMKTQVGLRTIVLLKNVNASEQGFAAPAVETAANEIYSREKFPTANPERIVWVVNRSDLAAADGEERFQAVHLSWDGRAFSDAKPSGVLNRKAFLSLIQ